MQIKSYEEAAKYLESFIGKIVFKVDPECLKHHDPLERMRVLLGLLGNPQEKFKSVLIGGTSGKGSTAYLVSHILTIASYKTGLTISPHLQKISERLQIDGEQISDVKFTKMVGSMVQIIELMSKKPVGVPSYFEILIAMAFLYFAQEKVDIAVVEVGMGGEFDATNTLYPLIAVLTNVSLDHTNVLGGTVQKIARTKAGIIKDRSSLRSLRQFSANGGSAKAPREPVRDLIVVTGVKQPSVIKIVEGRCKNVGAKLYRIEKDFDFKIKKESLEGSVFDVTIINGRLIKLHDLSISLLGRHQVENASLAIETVLQLRKFGFTISQEDIRTALKTAFFPGRFEIIPLKDTRILRYKDIKNKKVKSPSILISQYPNISIVLDGAHNPTKMKAFLTTLKKLYPKERKVFIVGFKFDKDIPKMLRQILKVADTLVITQFHGKTDVSINASTDVLSVKYKVLSSKYKGEIIVEEDSKKALDKALGVSAIQQFNNLPRRKAGSTIIVVTGSLYLVGEIRNML